MKFYPALVLVALCCLVGPVTGTHAEDAVNATVTRLKADIAFLADDAQEGRDVGSEGIARAGEFIVDRFKELGLVVDSFDGTAYQEFTLPGPADLGPPEQNLLVFASDDDSSTATLGTDFNSLSLGSSGAFDGELVFAGYGISAPDLGYDDYADIDVDGKVVIVIRKEPQQQNEDSIFEGRRSSQYAFFSSKELNAAVHKVAAMIIVNDRISAGSGDLVMPVTAAGAALSEQQVPTMFCTRALIDPILKKATGKSLSDFEEAIDGDVTPRSQVLEGVRVSGETNIAQTKIPVRNVIGLLPGAGDLAEEYVVVGAHYDHVGMGGQGSLAPGTVAIHNGADDNASGTTAMMEVARRFAEDKSENRRSLIFMAFTGEERGLLGSKYYVRNPRWPLENTVAMVNMDMVGRLTDNRLTVYGTGTATSFDALVERLNETAGFSLAKQEAGFGPSDHSSFYTAEIPVFHFFTGLHNDYHRPSDDVDKVNYEGMARISSMVSEAVRELAMMPERPEYVRITSVADVGRGSSRNRPSRAVLGITLDLGRRDASGAAVQSIPADGPASKAGLLAGDVITKIGETEIESVRDLRTAMAGKKPGDEVTVSVTRGEETLELQLTLGEG